METSIITWTQADGATAVTRVLAHHVAPFSADVTDVGGTVQSVRDEQIPDLPAPQGRDF